MARAKERYDCKVDAMLYARLGQAHEQLSQCLETLTQVFPLVQETDNAAFTHIAQLLTEAQGELSQLTREARRHEAQPDLRQAD